MPIAGDPSFDKRQWGGRGSRNDKPWWCNFWPPACPTPSTPPGTPGGGGNHPGSTTKTPIRAPTTTSPKATVPHHTPPVATRPPAVPPAATQSPKPSNRPQPVPSPTSQPWVPPPMPPPTDTVQTSAQTAPVTPVIVQPGGSGSSGNNPGNDNDNGPPSQGGDSETGTGDGNEDGGSNGTGGSGNGDPRSSPGNPPAHTGVTSAPAPSPTGASGTGGIAGGNPGGTAEAGSGDTSGGGLQPGAIAGIVVGLLLLLALLALLLYKFRRSPAVQRMLAPFRKLGGQSGGSARVDTPGGDGMGRTLISPGPGATTTAGETAAASAARNRGAQGPQSQPPMRQTGHLHPLAGAAAAVGRDSNRVSTFTYDSVATTGFTPSPVSPVSPASMLSPGAVRTSRPVRAPPDPRIIAATNARVTRGSVSSTSTGSGISAALSPGQMAWPMPPGTPPAIQHPNGPQYLDFQESGETVVRINQPPRSNRRSGGY